MRIKGITDEDFVNYKKPSMFIAFPSCNFKCERECPECHCQNGALANSPDIHTDVDKLCKRYLENPITKAVVCGGLEPIDSITDLYAFITTLRVRYKCDDDIVIYTGYTEEEMKSTFIPIWHLLVNHKNIIMKYGRYIPGEEPHYDEVLGVNLASSNQYAKVVSYK